MGPDQSARGSLQLTSWDFCVRQSDLLVREIKGMKFLVIDEADRMIENGHFAELDNIVKLTRRSE